MRYTNPHAPFSRRSLGHFLLWKMGWYREAPQKEIPPNFVYPVKTPPVSPGAPSALWVGHSTFLLEVEGIRILTDPVWSRYCAPIPLPVFRRRSPVPCPLEGLPPIDFVLISHNHYDHLDEKTIQDLHAAHPHIQWIVPEGLSPWFHRRSIFLVRELGWWQSLCLSRLCITAVPSQHFSGRSLWDKNHTHWNGYVVEVGEKTVYFAGDTGYNPYDFVSIGKRWSSIDLSLLPIGAYRPRKFMQMVHVSPKEAVQIHLDVKSSLSIAMHWNTFCLSEEPQRAPPHDLFLAMEEKGVPLSSFVAVGVGTNVPW